MSNLTALKAAASLTDVAALIGFKPSGLSYLLYRKAAESKYIKFEIPKRNGGTRLISAPTADLMLAQRRLANLLQNCVEEINKANGYADSIAHGFKRGRSIVTNAKEHRRSRFVFNVDLSNFFGAINFGRVRGFFLKDRNFALSEKVATVLAQIACFENALPQGSPCSPVLSNLIAHVLDIHLVRLAARFGCTYTRYADDLTFSSNAHHFPPAIAVLAPNETNVWTPGPMLEKLVHKSGFAINSAKTRMQYFRSRQDVTGLTVNRRVNTRREYRHVVRAMVHHLINSGSFEIVRLLRDGEGNVARESKAGTAEQLRGMLGFVDQVDEYNKGLTSGDRNEPSRDELPMRKAVYRRFLLYTEFFATPLPTLVGEGSTDYVYLLHAIRRLAATYPKLAAVAADGKVTLLTRIYKYSGSSTDRILGLHGGTANLKKLIQIYHSEKKHFSGPGATAPVILVIDNDSGATPVYKYIAQLTKKEISGKELFVHITGNLYVVATPLGPDAATSQMEDFFDATTKATVIDGKNFDDSNNTDSATKYGKVVFAHKVVKTNAGKIDFGGFAPILDRIVAVIDEHAKKVATAAALADAPT